MNEKCSENQASVKTAQIINQIIGFETSMLFIVDFHPICNILSQHKFPNSDVEMRAEAN
jgi:hypothetical protein